CGAAPAGAGARRARNAACMPILPSRCCSARTGVISGTAAVLRKTGAAGAGRRSGAGLRRGCALFTAMAPSGQVASAQPVRGGCCGPGCCGPGCCGPGCCGPGCCGPGCCGPGCCGPGCCGPGCCG